MWALRVAGCAGETLERLLGPLGPTGAHDHAAVAYFDALGPQLLGVSLLSARHKAPVCGDNAPPRNRRAVATQRRSNRTRCARLTDFGRHFAIGNDLTNIECSNMLKHPLLKFGRRAASQDGTRATTSIASSKPATSIGPTVIASVLTISAEMKSFGTNSWPGAAISASRAARFTIEPM